MIQWHDFFMACVGSSATLTGLLFIGISINLQKIISVQRLVNRGMLALIFLLIILIVSILFLVPDRPTSFYGVTVLIITSAAALIITRLDILLFKDKESRHRIYTKFYPVINTITIMCYIICSVLLIIEGEEGMYWIVPAIVLSYVKAILDAWILLVEILR